MIVTASYDVRGGSNFAGMPRADAGRVVVSSNHKRTLSMSSSPSQENGPVLTLPGLVPEASQASPYIFGAPTVPYIAGLEGGAAVAGVIPGLKATTLVNPATLPFNALAALLMLDTDVPGITYDKSKYRALLFLNLSPSPQVQIFAMGIGGSQFGQVLNTFGWANDSRFGAVNGPQNILALGDAVYVTLVPIGQLNQNLARLGGYFRNATNTGTEVLIADSTTFGVGTSKILTVRRACPCDLNADGIVDDSDFIVFAQAYNNLIDPMGDFNNDGVTDDADFVIFAAAYNTLLCP